MVWAGLSVIWIAAALFFVLSTWESSTHAVHELYDQRERQCVSRYADPQARERCLIIMDLERFQSRSIAMFNRAMLVLGPPILGLGIPLYFHRRRRPAPRKRR
jgi:hypothetical protein